MWNTYCTSVRAAAGINYTSIRLDSSHFCLKMSALDNLQEILGKAVRVVLVDGRVIEGSLSCMDKDLNFIIADACEYHGVTDTMNFDPASAIVRNIGSAMIPGAHVVQVLTNS